MARARSNHADVTAQLEAAAVATREGAWTTAADMLVAAWKLAPSARIARVLVLVDKNLPAPVPLDDKTVSARDLHWHELARSVSDDVLPTLFAEDWPVHPQGARARVEALANRPKSPRTSTALVTLLRRGQYRSRVGRLVTRRIYALLIDNGDPAVTELLTALDADRSEAADAERASMPAIMKRRRPVEPVWELRENAALTAIETLLAPAANTHVQITSELMRAVYAAPEDDAPRLVLADHLIERGDPRGELIALQIQRGREGRRGGVAHERALIRRGGSAWFDGLDKDGATEIVFERGFPSACWSLGQHVRVPAWATIERLTLLSRGVPFRGGPNLRGLRELHGLYALHLGGIHHLERELDTLWLVDGTLMTLDMQTRVAPVTLGLTDSQLTQWRAKVRDLGARIHEWPIGRRLKTLQLETTGLLDLALAFELLAAAPHLVDVVLAPEFGASPGWSARVTRDALALTWNGGVGGAPYESIVDVIRRLPPPTVETVTLTGIRGIVPDLVIRVRDQLRRMLDRWPNVRVFTLK